MLTPDYLYSVSDDAVFIYSQLSDDILDDIARRIVIADYLTPTAEWQLLKLSQMGSMSGDTVKYLANATGKSKREISRIMKNAGVEALKYDDGIYQLAGKTPTPLFASPALKAIILQGSDDAMKIIGNYTKSLATMSSKALGNAMDRAYLQIMSGAFSPNTAIRAAVNELAGQGFESIAYPSGSIDRVETVVRRAVTTAVNQSTAKLTISRMDEMECELVEVSSHSGARPSHSVWQGEIYSRNGRKGRYADFVGSTGYGSGDGLCGYNCYHSFFPFFEGLSTRSFSKDPSSQYSGKSNDEVYEESQKQRKYERDVRQAKQECTTLNACLLYTSRCV